MTRCPECYGTFVAFPVPDNAVVVDGRGYLGASILTLADPEREQYLDYVDRSKAKCLDCKHLFDGSNQ